MGHGDWHGHSRHGYEHWRDTDWARQAAVWFGRGAFRGRGFGSGWSGMPFGSGGWPFGRGPGPKVRKGDVRAAALALIAEEPRNGYQIIQAIAERSGGVWCPGSGSVYPALQQLEDEGLVRAEEVGGKKRYRLTDEGRAYVEAHREELKDPWGEVAGTVDDDATGLHAELARLGMAIVQVLHAGQPAQIAKVRQVVIGATRSLYQILAEANGRDEVD